MKCLQLNHVLIILIWYIKLAIKLNSVQLKWDLESGGIKADSTKKKKAAKKEEKRKKIHGKLKVI